MSYKCDKEEPFNMSLPTNINVTVATLVVSNLRIEAFHNSTGHVFSSGNTNNSTLETFCIQFDKL